MTSNRASQIHLIFFIFLVLELYSDHNLLGRQYEVNFVGNDCTMKESLDPLERILEPKPYAILPEIETSCV